MDMDKVREHLDTIVGYAMRMGRAKERGHLDSYDMWRDLLEVQREMLNNEILLASSQHS